MAQIGIPDSEVAATEVATATFVTTANNTDALPNSRRLLVGDNVTFDDSTPGVRRISSPAGGVCAPAIVRKRYVIRAGIDGIVKDTVDDAQAAINLAAMQAIVDAADSDGAIVEMEQETIEISGGPLIIRSSANGLIWDSPTFARLTQRSNNVAVLQIGDTADVCQNLDFSGINLHYLNDQAAFGTPTTVGSTACVIYNQWKSRIGKIQVSNTLNTARPYRGIYFPQSQTVFSCYFHNLFSFQAHYSLLHYANFGTGNVWDNVYLSGVGSNGLAQTVSAPFLYEMSGGGQMHEGVFNELNVEWCISNKLLRVNNWRGGVFNSLHIEQCKLAGAGPSVISNSISNIQVNGGAILDLIITATDVTDAFPNIVRSANDGRTMWNNLIWVNNSSAFVTMPYFLHYQADNEGVITLPAKCQFNSARVIDASGTVLRDNMRVDRWMGGTDADGAAWGNLYLTGGAQIRSGGAGPVVVEGDHRVEITKTIYGADFINSAFVVPGNLTGGDITITFSNRMGPPSARWANVPVPIGSTLSVCRGGTTTNVATFANHDASTIATIGSGVASSRLNFYFNSSGNWVAA